MPWTNIILDFVTRLSPSNGYNPVLIVIHGLSKEKYYILNITNTNCIIARAIN